MSSNNWKRLRNTSFAIMEKNRAFISFPYIDILTVPDILIFINVTPKHYSLLYSESCKKVN
jgi:hypothetical protein